MDDNLLKNFMNELGEDYNSKSYEKYIYNNSLFTDRNI